MSNTIGGTERVVQNLSKNLAARGHDMQTVLTDGPETADTLAWFRDAGVPAETHPSILGLYTPRSNADTLALGKFVRDSKADGVLIHYPQLWILSRDVMAVKILGGKRCVVAVHHPTPLDHVDEKKRKRTRLAALLTDVVAAPTDILRCLLLEIGVPARKIRRTSYGVPVPESLPARYEARQRLGLPLDAFVVATLARLTPNKGTADLIEAVARVPDPTHRLRLIVAGDGEQRNSLEAQASEHLQDRALFLGRVPDTADVYAAADVFCLPSIADEGFGLVFIEAAFHGVPSIGTNIGGIPEAIADGKTGLLVPVKDPAALAEAIVRLRDDPALRQRLGEAARERAQTEFAASVMAKHYEELLFT